MEASAQPTPFAAGICPQGFSTGAKFRGVGCGIEKALNGWDITVDEMPATESAAVLILTPGRGSNIAGGVSFGQGDPSPDNPRLFSFSVYRNDTNAVIDVEVGFTIVALPGYRRPVPGS